MVWPAIIAAGASLAPALMKKKPTDFNSDYITQQINQAGQEQRGIIVRGQPETKALTDAFGNQVNAAQTKAKTAREAERERYLAELDPVSSRLLQSQTDQLKRTTFGAIPEAQQATREALAASGGLSRGVSAESLARVPINAAQQFSEGAASLQRQSLDEQQAALGNLHSEESQAIAKDLGIDEDTYKTILDTGNQALINELNGLISESKTRNAGLQDAEILRQTGNIAGNSAANANQQAIFQSLANVAGQYAGSQSAGNGVQSVPQYQRSQGQVNNEELIRRRNFAK